MDQLTALGVAVGQGVDAGLVDDGLAQLGLGQLRADPFDRAAALLKNAAAGANETDYHFVGVNRGRDWEGTIADIRLVTDVRCRLPDGSVGRVAIVMDGPGPIRVCQVATLQRIRA